MVPLVYIALTSPSRRNQRTLLLFVIRDFIGATPLANLQATLTADMQKIWETLSKPSELKDKQLSDYFDLSFAALPHKILAADKFESEVVELRKRFVDKSRENYVFSPAYHKRIPADGVAFYMEGIWVSCFYVSRVFRTLILSQEQVQTNKDLDLPTQRELLAQFRCDEISGAALAEFIEQAKPQRRPVESGKVVDGLGKMMRAWRTQALGKLNTTTMISCLMMFGTLHLRPVRSRRITLPPERVQAQARRPRWRARLDTLPPLPRAAQESAQSMPRKLQEGDA